MHPLVKDLLERCGGLADRVVDELTTRTHTRLVCRGTLDWWHDSALPLGLPDSVEPVGDYTVEVTIDLRKLADCSIAAQEAFIRAHLEKNKTASAVDEVFHEGFYRRFGGKRNIKFFGAQPCPRAQQRLHQMWQDGVLARVRMGMEYHAGWPTWVWVYELRPLCQNCGKAADRGRQLCRACQTTVDGMLAHQALFSEE